MKKHSLLLYEQISQRIRNKLLLVIGFLLILGIVDLVQPFLGQIWWILWVVLLILVPLWLYYGLLMRRASIQVHRPGLRLQGPLMGLNLSYKRIHSVTSAQVSQHYPPDKLKSRERELLAPFYRQTCIFVEVTSFPDAFKESQWWFPRFLFGTSRPGLLLVTEDWLTLSQDIEAARARWHDRRGTHRRGDNRSFAARILDGD